MVAVTLNTTLHEVSPRLKKKQPGLGDQTEKVLESRCAVKLGALQTSYPAARKRPLTVLHIPEHAADDVGVDRDACTVS